MSNEKHESGAIRSGDAMGVDYWLITPIGIRRLINAYRMPYNTDANVTDDFFDNIFEYLSGNRDEDFLAKAAMSICELIEDQSNIDSSYYRGMPIISLRRLAETYNEGKIKYSEYNCELGFPISSLLNHAMKHVVDYMIDDTKEVNSLGQSIDLPHALWNVLMAMHSEERTPEVNTLLRGPGCTLTEPIRKHIKETIEKKYGQQSDTSIRDDSSQRKSISRRAHRDDWPYTRIS